MEKTDFPLTNPEFGMVPETLFFLEFIGPFQECDSEMLLHQHYFEN